MNIDQTVKQLNADSEREARRHGIGMRDAAWVDEHVLMQHIGLAIQGAETCNVKLAMDNLKSTIGSLSLFERGGYSWDSRNFPNEYLKSLTDLSAELKTKLLDAMSDKLGNECSISRKTPLPKFTAIPERTEHNTNWMLGQIIETKDYRQLSPEIRSKLKVTGNPSFGYKVVGTSLNKNEERGLNDWREELPERDY